MCVAPVCKRRAFDWNIFQSTGQPPWLTKFLHAWTLPFRSFFSWSSEQNFVQNTKRRRRRRRRSCCCSIYATIICSFSCSLVWQGIQSHFAGFFLYYSSRQLRVRPTNPSIYVPFCHPKMCGCTTKSYQKGNEETLSSNTNSQNPKGVVLCWKIKRTHRPRDPKWEKHVFLIMTCSRWNIIMRFPECIR